MAGKKLVFCPICGGNQEGELRFQGWLRRQKEKEKREWSFTMGLFLGIALILFLLLVI